MTSISNARIRPMAVAGTFYPSDPQELGAAVDGFVAQARVEAFPDAVAAIAPHAGYVYSGPIAGSAYRSIEAPLNEVSRVVLIGPSHRVAFHGIALSGYAAFQSPLGVVPIDQPTYTRLRELPFVMVKEEAHAQEHGLEVHLPFLQRVIKSDFALVPMVVGQATPDQVAAAIEAACEGQKTFVLISSDLSHFLDYATAQAKDTQTTEAIVAADLSGIAPDGACGAAAIRGYLATQGAANQRVEVLDLRNSGDTAGGRDRVVGYGAYVFH